MEPESVCGEIFQLLYERNDRNLSKFDKNLKNVHDMTDNELKWSEVAQLCPTLCDPMDCSLPDSFVHGILQASGLPFPFPGDLPYPGIEPGSPALQADTWPSEPPGKSDNELRSWKKSILNYKYWREYNFNKVS